MKMLFARRPQEKHNTILHPCGVLAFSNDLISPTKCSHADWLEWWLVVYGARKQDTFVLNLQYIPEFEPPYSNDQLD